VSVAGFGTSNVEYMCSLAVRMCGCECCVCVLCVRTCRCLLSRVHACTRARPCVRACMFLPWTCVGARKRVSASVALPQSSTVTDAAQTTQLSPNFSVLSGSGSLSMSSTTPRMQSRIVRLYHAQRISTCAIEATQETARYRSATDQRRQRICAQAAHTLDAKASAKLLLTGEHVRRDTRSEARRSGTS
jgi:hypothetical protein